MLGDQAIGYVPATDGSLPILTPVLVAGASDAASMIREGRARLAMLTLRLRSTLDDLARAEGADEHAVDVSDAEDLLRTSLGRHLDKRRREFDEAVERARVEAAAIVTAAHNEAVALLAGANAELVETLLEGVSAAAGDATPSLRVVGDGRDVGRVQAAHSPPAPALPLPPMPPPADTDSLPAGGVGDGEAATVGTAQPPAPGDARLNPPGWEQGQVALAQLLAMWSTQTPLADPPESHFSTLSAVSAVDLTPTSGRWSIKQFLYLDVMLPLIAVIIVIIVLLAWVG